MTGPADDPAVANQAKPPAPNPATSATQPTQVAGGHPTPGTQASASAASAPTSLSSVASAPTLNVNDPTLISASASEEVPKIADVELQNEIGRGGMGRVWRGRQIYLDRPVAVKLLLIDARHGGAEYVKRFQREARILSKLAHPHIVGCYQAGLTDSGLPYLVMEFIDGKNLRDWVATNGALPPAQALTMICDLARALEHAQANGIIHRDIKPENVLLASLQKPSDAPASATTQIAPTGLPWIAKLVDLGLARPSAKGSGGSDMHLTMQGVVMGTPATMAPEQFGDPDNVDFRADIYGLGCVLFHALTAKPAFTSNTLGEILTAKVSGPVPNPSLTRAELPAGVSDIVTWMLAREATARPQSYQELIQRCEQAIGGRAAAPRGAPVGLIAAALAIAAVVAITVIAAVGHRSTAAPAAPAPTAAAPVASTPDTAPGPASQVPAGDGGAQVQPFTLGALTLAAPVSFLGSSADNRLAGWTVPGDSSWAASEDQDDAISGAHGVISHPLPGPRVRITAQLRLNSAKTLSLCLLGDDGKGVIYKFQDFVSTIGVSSLTGTLARPFSQQTITVDPAPVVPVTMTLYDKHVVVEAGGIEMSTINLAAIPTQLVLGASASGDNPVEVVHLGYQLVSDAAPGATPAH